MSIEAHKIPLSLYIHVPWCVRKCPYCDFNSHPLKAEIPELAYVNALIADLQQQLHLVQNRPIHSIFIGGGTPSLLSADAYQGLFSALYELVDIYPNTEITLEANPGTVEQARFSAYRQLGINRLSLGIQSFQDDKLKMLGRIHSGTEALAAIKTAKKAGFDNFNLDLMFGLPQQHLADALFDLQTALECQPTHLSWYQLTLEPNTAFAHTPPTLPEHDAIADMQDAGQALLKQRGFKQYEISAYSKDNRRCLHNLNYWQFGDYIGIGAGAHGKVTDVNTGEVTRRWNIKHPKRYLDADTYCAEQKTIPHNELAIEFLLNALRLTQPVPIDYLEQRCKLSIDSLSEFSKKAAELDLLHIKNQQFCITPRGSQYLNDLLALL